jgi:hypothetical protein
MKDLLNPEDGRFNIVTAMTELDKEGLKKTPNTKKVIEYFKSISVYQFYQKD